MQLHKYCVVLCQRLDPQESDSYQGLLTCLFSHLWRKIQGCSPQQEAGGEQRGRRRENKPPSEGGGGVREGEGKKGRRGREREIQRL